MRYYVTGSHATGSPALVKLTAKIPLFFVTGSPDCTQIRVRDEQLAAMGDKSPLYRHSSKSERP